MTNLIMVGILSLQDCMYFYFISFITISYTLKFFTSNFARSGKHLFIKSMYALLLTNIKAAYIWTYLTQLLFLITYKTTSSSHTDVDMVLFYFSLIYILISLMILLFSHLYMIGNKDIELFWNWSMFLFIGLMHFHYVDNFLYFIFLVEVISIIYYFFFLSNISKVTGALIRYRNLLSNYIWSSYLILMFSALFIYILTIAVGTLNFLELKSFLTENNNVAWQLLLVSIFLKVGVPGFHFFKLELYKLLSVTSLIFFSLFTLFINFFILSFILINYHDVFLHFNQTYLVYLLIINIFLLVRGYLVDSVFNFLALSSVNTWATIAVFALV